MSESKTSAVYQALKNDIIALKYDVDEIILEKDIADKNGVSKTPAREALNMLVQEGYLRKYPRVGYMVNEVSNSRYYDLLFLRFTLEKGVIAAIIASCADEEIESLYEYCQDRDISYRDWAGVNIKFHLAMADLTGNQDLANAVRETFSKLIRPPSKNMYQQFYSDPHRKHRGLIAALLRRDHTAAVQILRDECRRDDDIDLWF